MCRIVCPVGGASLCCLLFVDVGAGFCFQVVVVVKSLRDCLVPLTRRAECHLGIVTDNTR